jgi:hypothetical protein
MITLKGRVGLPYDAPRPPIGGDAESEEMKGVVMQLCCRFQLDPADVLVSLRDVEQYLACPVPEGVCEVGSDAAPPHSVRGLPGGPHIN